MGLTDKSRMSAVPGEKRKTHEGEDDEEELDRDQSKSFRALAARGVYSSQDRGGISFSVKESGGSMAKPTQRDWRNMKRLARYLTDKLLYSTLFAYQSQMECIITWTDSDWAGCVKTRLSTIGGVAMLGKHPIKRWASQQGIVAPKSGEAE